MRGDVGLSVCLKERVVLDRDADSEVPGKGSVYERRAQGRRRVADAAVVIQMEQWH